MSPATFDVTATPSARRAASPADPARRAASLANPARPPRERVGAIDWGRVECELEARGYATTGPLLTAGECETLASLYDAEGPFRARVVMAHHGFGAGEYKYFAYPLPPLVAELRAAAYRGLAPIARRWAEALGREGAWPDEHEAFLARCREGGQPRPTPLLLRYGPGDHNCLHQDLYGALSFPLQLAALLDEPGRDFEGGEFVLVEQRARRQSRAEVVPLGRGEGVIFAVNHRPVRGARGVYRGTLRHGVSRVRAGRRRALGIIFHDAA